eukprot:m.4182 g.4182  ORF g.4182 m.4182 type:complete len:214 (+) comp2915_c0_seq1:317-958(+)
MGKKAKAKEKKEAAKRKLLETSPHALLIKEATAAANLLEDVDDNSKIFETPSGDRVLLECKNLEQLTDAEFSWAFQLVKSNMMELYQRSKGGWVEKGKKKEMKTPGMKYLIASDTKGNQLGFASGLFDVEDDCAVFYLYEIMVDTSARKQSVGMKLMQAFEAISSKFGMEKVMLTCLKDNTGGQHFFKGKCNYEVDSFSPDDADYDILSKKTS